MSTRLETIQILKELFRNCDVTNKDSVFAQLNRMQCEAQQQEQARREDLIRANHNYVYGKRHY